MGSIESPPWEALKDSVQTWQSIALFRGLVTRGEACGRHRHPYGVSDCNIASGGRQFPACSRLPASWAKTRTLESLQAFMQDTPGIWSWFWIFNAYGKNEHRNENRRHPCVRECRNYGSRSSLGDRSYSPDRSHYLQFFIRQLAKHQN